MSISEIKSSFVEQKAPALDSYVYSDSNTSSHVSGVVRFPIINSELPNKVYDVKNEDVRKICYLINLNLQTFFTVTDFRPSGNQNIASYLFHCLGLAGASEDEIETLLKIYKSDPKEFAKHLTEARFNEIFKNSNQKVTAAFFSFFKAYHSYLQYPYETILVCTAATAKKEEFGIFIQQLAGLNFLSRSNPNQTILQAVQAYFFERLLLIPCSSEDQDQLFQILGKAQSETELQEDIQAILPKLQLGSKSECEALLVVLKGLKQFNLSICLPSSLLPFLPAMPTKMPTPKSHLLLLSGGFEAWKRSLNALTKELQDLSRETDILPAEKHKNRKKIAQSSDFLTAHSQIVSKIDSFLAIKGRLLEQLNASFKESQDCPEKAATFQFQFEESAFLLDFLLELQLNISQLHLENLELQEKYPKDLNLQLEGRVLKRRLTFLQGFANFTEFFFASETRLTIVERAKARQKKALEITESEEMLAARPKKRSPIATPPISLDHAKDLASSSPSNFLQAALSSGAAKVVKFDFIGVFSPFLLLKRETLDSGSIRSKEGHDHFIVAAQYFEMWAATLSLQRFELSKVCLHQFLTHTSIALEQHLKRNNDPSEVTEHHSLVRLANDTRQPVLPLYQTLDECITQMHYPVENRSDPLSKSYHWIDQFERLSIKPTHLKTLQKEEIPEIIKSFKDSCSLLGYADKDFEKLVDNVETYLVSMKWNAPQSSTKKSAPYQKLEIALKANTQLLIQNGAPYDPIPVLKEVLYFLDFIQKSKDLAALFPDQSLSFCHLSNQFEAEKALRALLKGSALCRGSDVILGHHYRYFTDYLKETGIVIFDPTDWKKLNGAYLGLKHHYWHILDEGHDSVSYYKVLDQSLEHAKGFKEVQKKKEKEAELQKDPRPVHEILERLIMENLDLLLNIRKAKTIPKKV